MGTNEKRIGDKELLLRLRAGDESAFEVVYDLHKARILRNLLKLVRSEAIAAELHQDIFLRLWQYREKVDVDRPLSAYLVTIAKHVAIDFYKKAGREKRLQAELMATLEIRHEGLEELIHYKETQEILKRIIDRLPPQRGRVYRLIKLEHNTYEEAAAHFGVSVGTIKDHMAKATRFIQKEFGKPDQMVWVLVFVHAILSTF